MSRVFRVLAVAIALAGLVDPVLTVTVPLRPVVALLVPDEPAMAWPAASGGTRAGVATALAERVRTELSDVATVVTGPRQDAEVVIAIGATARPPLPPQARFNAVAVPPRVSPNASIRAVGAPRFVHEHEIPAIDVRLESTGLAGRTSVLTVSSRGLVIARREHVWSTDSDDTRIEVRVAPIEADATFRVEISTESDLTALDDAADIVVRRRSRPYRVLVFEPRPSWQTTFARRALEGDDRFEVVQRTSVSRGRVVSSAVRPPALDDLAAFDAVLVGAPEALGAGEVSSLERFVRERGGGLVLAPDRAVSGSIQRLLGSSRYELVRRGAPMRLGVLSASELWLARDTEVGVDTLVGVAIDGRQRPAVTAMARGVGTMLVVGALDAWRFRNDEFDRWWRDTAAAVAARAPEPLELDVPALVAAGEPASFRMAVRPDIRRRLEGALLHAELQAGPRRYFVRLWPTTASGIFTGVVPASQPGRWTLRARAGDLAADASIDVREPPHPAAPNDTLARLRRTAPALTFLARARGGDVFPEQDIGTLITRLRSEFVPRVQPGSRRPMGSPWWMLAFAGCLGAEWWLRRRTGLR